MLTDEERRGIDIALNEATWMHLQVHVEKHAVAIGLRVLTLPLTGAETTDSGRWLVLRRVSRIAASYRRGRWDDQTAPVVPLTVRELSETVQQLAPTQLYGWEFVDAENEKWKESSHRLSMDSVWRDDSAPHQLTLFKEVGVSDFLDMWIWFTELEFQTQHGRPLPLHEVIAGGRRWWDSMYARDGRTMDHGIFPLG